MQAIVQARSGSADGLELREIEKPVAGDDEVVVRVRAASVNAADWHMMRLLTHVIAWVVRVPRSRVPGVDLAGYVEAVGKNVTRFKSGDAVFGAGRGTF